MERRKTKLSERLQKCQCCEHPISERHHLLEVSQYGDNEYTFQLCPNCHELYHILSAALTYGTQAKAANKLLKRVESEWGSNSKVLNRIRKIVTLVSDAKEKMILAFQEVENYKARLMVEQAVNTLVKEAGYTLIPPGYRGETCPCCGEKIEDIEHLNADIDTHYFLVSPKGSPYREAFKIPQDRIDI